MDEDTMNALFVEIVFGGNSSVSQVKQISADSESVGEVSLTFAFFNSC